jgi:hypothetical protein
VHVAAKVISAAKVMRWIFIGCRFEVMEVR